MSRGLRLGLAALAVLAATPALMLAGAVVPIVGRFVMFGGFALLVAAPALGVASIALLPRDPAGRAWHALPGLAVLLAVGALAVVVWLDVSRGAR
jgi:hypothetical protein